MLKEVQNQVYRSLQKGNACTINRFIEQFSCIKAVDILEIFVNIFKRDRNENYELLCHVVVANNQQVRIQLERYSNIQRGVMTENHNHLNTHQFPRDQIKQLKILAIFPKELLISDVSTMIQMSTLTKTKEYVNKFVLVPKISVQNTALIKNKSKKQEKKQQKPIQNTKKEQPIIEQKKFIKKTQSKSSMQIEQKPVVAPLKKTSSKDQSMVVTPVLTSYAVQRAKVVEEVQPKMVQSKKLNLDSDEEYFNLNPNIFNEQMKNQIEKSQETDHSAIKGEQQNEKMEIETQNMKTKKEINKFIVDDDEDDQDDSFAKMIVASKKKETQSEHNSTTTQPKKQNSITPPPPVVKPKVEAPKVNPPSKTQPPLGNKNAINLKSWLIPKKV